MKIVHLTEICTLGQVSTVMYDTSFSDYVGEVHFELHAKYKLHMIDTNKAEIQTIIWYRPIIKFCQNYLRSFGDEM